MKELKIAVRVIKQGSVFTTIGIIVGDRALFPTDVLGYSAIMEHDKVVPFLDRLKPTAIEWSGIIPIPFKIQAESDLAALRESRPDVQKINGEMLAALEAFQIWDVSQQIGEDNSSEEAEQRIFDSYQRAADLMRAAIRNAKEAQ